MGQASYAVKSDITESDPHFLKERRCGPIQVGPTPTEARAYQRALADKQAAEQNAEMLQKSVEQRGESEELSKANEEIGRLKQEHENDAIQIQQLQEYIRTLQSEDQAKIEAELRGQFQQMEARLQVTMASLKAEKQALQEEFQQLQHSLATAQAANEKLEAEKEELKQKANQAMIEYAAREQEYLSRKAEGHVASQDEMAMSQEQLLEQIRSLEAMHEALKREFGRQQQEHHELEETLTETRGLYHSKSQEKIEIETQLREHEEKSQAMQQRLAEEVKSAKQLQESQAKKFLDLCKFWGDVQYTITKKNQTFRVKDSKGIVLELAIEAKDYNLRELIDAVNAVYRNRVTAQIASRKSTLN